MSSSFNNNNTSSEEEEAERKRQEYNDYVLRDGIHEKIQAKIDKEFQMKMFDKVYTRTRQRIRQKGGMVSHDIAMKWVIATQSKEILEEIYNDALNEDEYLKKHNPLLLENLRLDKPPEVREQAMRIYDDMMKRFE